MPNVLLGVGREYGIGEIRAAVLDAGLAITGFEEHRSGPCQAMPDLVAGEDGEFRLPERPDRRPLTYTLQAVKAAWNPVGGYARPH